MTIARPTPLPQTVMDLGIRSLAVVLKHAAIFPTHEQQVGAIAREMGFTQVSLSHEVMPMVKMVPRGFTAAADAYLTPHIKRYLADFTAGFDEGLKDVQVGLSRCGGGCAWVSMCVLWCVVLACMTGPAASQGLPTSPNGRTACSLCSK